jgi:2-oxoglutarate ferredoxin oxidoreductase subunit beta
MEDQQSEVAAKQINLVGLSRADYRGLPSTLCPGCGHNSIANQIINACFELSVRPENLMKFSGIGCSSKSPTYFLPNSFGFNGVHGRMPSFATGASFANKYIKILGVSGDGDTASIGMGQFKHAMRRNTPMVYIIENNGVYGLTKGQYSATAEQGIQLKHHAKTKFLPVDICLEALSSYATFVARSFAGDPKQVKELIKAALSHNGIAVIDIISPCVTFHNLATSLHSYTGGKGHEIQLHDVEFTPALDEITVEDFDEGMTREVTLHDGGRVVLKKLEKDYDPTDRVVAFRKLEEARSNNWLVTGLVFIDPDEPNLHDFFNLVDTPLNRLTEKQMRPSKSTIDLANSLMA